MFYVRLLAALVLVICSCSGSFALTPVTGTFTVCVGATSTLSNPTAGGSWSSSNPAIAAVGTGSGIVTGIAAGTAAISYTLGAEVEFAVVTVSPLPNPGTISGPASVCVGANITLTNTATGGTWSSANTVVATVSAGGLVTGVSAGPTVISYSVSNACGAGAATKVVSVNALPNAGTITTAAAICQGATLAMSTTGTTGGTWSSATPAIASISSTTGLLSAVSAGTVTISYTHANACGTAVATTIATINPLPPAISGPSIVCRTISITLTNALSLGVWSTTTTNVTVDASTGEVTGVMPGTATIIYTLPSGCRATKAITVNPQPAGIVGATRVCLGASTTLTCVSTGGTWTSSQPDTLTIYSPIVGTIYGATVGTATVTYTIANGCFSTSTITVNPIPAAITGDLSICRSTSDTLFNAVPGGTWSSSSPGTASIDVTTGVVSTIVLGTVRISYTLPGGCRAEAILTIDPVPADITGDAQVCEGSTAFATNSVPGGVWTTSDVATAGILPVTGMLAGVAAGTATITYTMGTGCFKTRTVTVNPTPAAISGADAVCEGDTVTFATATTGGAWSSSHAMRATVDAAGIVSGVLSGTSTISYALPTGCLATKGITVNTTPGGVSGILSVCAGITSHLTNSPGGGFWSSSDVAVATIDAAGGVATGVAAGTAMLTYTLPASGCLATAVFTVNNLPASITGASTLCVGNTTTLASTTVGGSWSSSAPAFATVDATTGVVTGIATGIATISYTTPSGCSATFSLTVNPLPSAGSIGGLPTVCQGASIVLMPSLAGGSWSTANGNASVSATGVVTGVSGGVDTVIYSVVNACGFSNAHHIVTVNPLPDAGSITGNFNICIGSTRTLAGTLPGGIWSSADTTVSINGAGVASGLYIGTATISYTRVNACGPNSASVVVTVHALVDPGFINGLDTMCYRDTATMVVSVPGGNWASSNNLIATVDAAGVVTSINPGATTIMYIVSNTCSTDTAEHLLRVRIPADCYTGVAQLSSVNFEIVPNPNSGKFNVNTVQSGTLYMMAVDGRAVKVMPLVAGANTVQLDSEVAAGVYVCRFVASNGAVATQRIIIAN